MNDCKLPSQSIFRVRFTYSENGIVYSRVALVRAVNRHQAESRVTGWILRTCGPLPEFRFKTAIRFTDANYIVPSETFTVEDLPPSDPFESSAVARVRSMTKDELIAELGEFIEPEEYNIFM